MFDLSFHPHPGLVLIGGVFLLSAWSHARAFGARVAMLSGRGWPAPALLLAAGMALEVVGGSLFILGLLVPFAGALLILFTVVASVTLLDFWRQPAETRLAAQHGFTANVALVGGLLLATCHG